MGQLLHRCREKVKGVQGHRGYIGIREVRGKLKMKADFTEGRVHWAWGSWV